MAFCLLNSSVFFNWYTTYSDGFHLSDNIVKTFPVNIAVIENDFNEFSKVLEEDIHFNSIITTRNTKTDDIEIESFKMNQSKDILNMIDKKLSQLYKFTEEELDFIINYDIKYRMGGELNNEEE